jgi:peptidoglycan/xylan/chitin deacetylase (PgdA/CDA1 family)
MGKLSITRIMSLAFWCCVASAAACAAQPAAAPPTVATASNTAGLPSITPVVLLPGATSGPTLRAPVTGTNGAAASATPFVPTGAGPGAAAIPILMYHQIKDLLPTASLEDFTWTVSPSSMDAQLGYLADKGYVTISLDQLLDGLAGKAALPAKAVVLTFDDGWKSQYTNALPLLKKHNQTATFYVVSTYMGYGAYFDWNMTMEVKNAGMTIAGHTLDHADLPKLSAAELDHELRDSKAALEKQLGVPINHFAYPYGAYNDTVVEAVRRAGYRSATTLNPMMAKNPVSPFLLPRIRVSYKETLADFVKKLQ